MSPLSRVVNEAGFSRPYEVFPGVHVTLLDGKPIKRLASSDRPLCPTMRLEGDYLVLSTGARIHMAGGLVAWVKC